MKRTRVAAVGVVLALVAAPMPAWAVFCANEGPSAGYEIIFENGKSRRVVDTEAQARLDEQRLREIGVITDRAERWNGCIRAFVQRPDGGQAMEFYDPASLRRLQ